MVYVDLIYIEKAYSRQEYAMITYLLLFLLNGFAFWCHSEQSEESSIVSLRPFDISQVGGVMSNEHSLWRQW